MSAWRRRLLSVPILWKVLGIGAVVGALFGRAPMAMVRQLLLERAADLLRTTTLSLSEIADRVGYGTGFALSNAMSRHLQIRPQQVREHDPGNQSTAGT